MPIELSPWGSANGENVNLYTITCSTGASLVLTDFGATVVQMNRPLPEISDYRTPIEGLYLCGAGTHPGGGVSGAPGHNSAQVVIDDLDGRVRGHKSNTAVMRGPSVMDKIMQSDAGSNIGYLFARSRAFRAISRLGLKSRKDD